MPKKAAAEMRILMRGPGLSNWVFAPPLVLTYVMYQSSSSRQERNRNGRCFMRGEESASVRVTKQGGSRTLQREKNHHSQHSG